MRFIVEISSRGCDRRGVAALEYALLGALLASVLAAASVGLMPNVQAAFERMAPAEAGPAVSARFRPN
ncbi:hypothetical protein [Falsiroseomonas sp.]|uniref:hypothetical protein n=1 Tax=Falsiroseomonas sp. TaxID=2870721 RepID=UPI00356A2775